MWYITYSPSDIMHYGVIGMKWGIRRYQNPDGTLTELGKKRFAESQKRLISEGSKDNSRVHQKDYTLKKGTKFYRLADPNEPVDTKRKYVTTSIESYLDYETDAMEGLLNIKDPTNYSSYKYENKKDLKVAGYDTVMNLLVKNNPNFDISKEYDPFEYITAMPKKDYMLVQSAYNSIKNLTLKELVKEHYNTSKIESSFYLKGKNLVDDLVRNRANQIYKATHKAKNKLFDDAVSNEKVLSELSKLGYDAVCDVEDTSPTFYDANSLIIINPKKTLTLKEERKNGDVFGYGD